MESNYDSPYWIFFADEEQLDQYAHRNNVSRELIRQRQTEVLATINVARHRQLSWILTPYAQLSQEWYLQKALQRLGLHPQAYDNWKTVLRRYQIAWDFTYNPAGYLRIHRLWDASAEHGYREIPWGNMEFKRVYYTDRTLGAHTDWIPYLYVESAQDEYIPLACRLPPDEGRPICSTLSLLIPAIHVADHRTSEQVLRILTIWQMRWTDSPDDLGLGRKNWIVSVA